MAQREPDVPSDLEEALKSIPRRRISRRTLLKGSAAVAGSAAAASVLGPAAGPILHGLQPARGAEQPPVTKIVRTGHSNNCDGACGLDVHVTDGKVTMIEGGKFDDTRVDGAPAQGDEPYPARICLRGVSQVENLYSTDRIKYPYKRVGERGAGQWQQISWDEAVQTIADNFKTVQDKYYFARRPEVTRVVDISKQIDKKIDAIRANVAKGPGGHSGSRLRAELASRNQQLPLLGDDDLSADRNYIRQFGLTRNRELGKQYGMEFAEVFHYIPAGASGADLDPRVDEYVKQHAVPRK